MRTDELVAMLAAGAARVDPDATTRRFSTALGWGAFAATLWMAIAMGVRPDLSEAALVPMLWIKLAFPALLAVGALYAAARLSRPGASLGRVPVVGDSVEFEGWRFSTEEMDGRRIQTVRVSTLD